MPQPTTNQSKVSRRWTPERCQSLLVQSRSGVSKAEIARQLGISYSRIQQVFSMANRFERAAASANPFDILSLRTKNCLASENLFTVAQVQVAMNGGKLRCVQGLGEKTLEEIRQWLKTNIPDEIIQN